MHIQRPVRTRKIDLIDDPSLAADQPEQNHGMKSDQGPMLRRPNFIDPRTAGRKRRRYAMY